MAESAVDAIVTVLVVEGEAMATLVDKGTAAVVDGIVGTSAAVTVVVDVTVTISRDAMEVEAAIEDGIKTAETVTVVNEVLDVVLGTDAGGGRIGNVVGYIVPGNEKVTRALLSIEYPLGVPWVSSPMSVVVGVKATTTGTCTVVRSLIAVPDPAVGLAPGNVTVITWPIVVSTCSTVKVMCSYHSQ